jgi:hypothetical protein
LPLQKKLLKNLFPLKKFRVKYLMSLPQILHLVQGVLHTMAALQFFGFLHMMGLQW